MKYKDLRDFVGRLETLGELRRIPQNVSPVLEMTELCDRVLRAGGPALLFESRQSHAFPVLGNLFGTPRRVALGMGIDAGEQDGDSAALGSLRDVGRLLSALKEPEPPKGLRDAGKLFSLAKAVWDMAPKTVSSPPCQEIVWERRRCGSRQAADPDLLAGRRRPADHLGPDRHARAKQEPPEPRHLSPATDRT